MSKRTWVLVFAVLGLLVVGVYGILLVRMLGDRSSVEPTAPPAATAAEAAGGTAFEAYPRAEAIASAWQGDARLIGISATWREPDENALLNGGSTWVFQFFSPSASQVYRVTVGGTEAEGAPDRKLDAVPSSIDPAQVQVDSSDALHLFLSQGGREFLGDHHVTTVRLQLSSNLMPEQVVWMIAALSSTDRTGMSVVVDALSGEVVEVQSSLPGE